MFRNYENLSNFISKNVTKLMAERSKQQLKKGKAYYGKFCMKLMSILIRELSSWVKSV